MELNKLSQQENFNNTQVRAAEALLKTGIKITRKQLVESVQVFKEVEKTDVIMEDEEDKRVAFNKESSIATYSDGTQEETNLDALRNDGYTEVVATKSSSDFLNQTAEYRKTAVTKI